MHAPVQLGEGHVVQLGEGHAAEKPVAFIHFKFFRFERTRTVWCTVWEAGYLSICAMFGPTMLSTASLLQCLASLMADLLNAEHLTTLYTSWQRTYACTRRLDTPPPPRRK